MFHLCMRLVFRAVLCMWLVFRAVLCMWLVFRACFCVCGSSLEQFLCAFVRHF